MCQSEAFNFANSFTNCNDLDKRVPLIGVCCNSQDSDNTHTHTHSHTHTYSVSRDHNARRRSFCTPNPNYNQFTHTLTPPCTCVITIGPPPRATHTTSNTNNNNKSSSSKSSSSNSRSSNNYSGGVPHSLVRALRLSTRTSVVRYRSSKLYGESHTPCLLLSLSLSLLLSHFTRIRSKSVACVCAH